VANQSFFQASEKRFSHGVVPAVAFPGHALDASVLAKALAEKQGLVRFAPMWRKFFNKLVDVISYFH
jgi:hypothetical protein